MMLQIIKVLTEQPTVIDLERVVCLYYDEENNASVFVMDNGTKLTMPISTEDVIKQISVGGRLT